MYKIVLDTGKVLGYTDNIRWIKKHDNGCYVTCPVNEATGVAFKSIPYSLSSTAPLEGAKGVVYVFEEVDADTLFSHTQEIADTQNATCDLSMELVDAIAEIENALCDLSEEV